MICPYSASYENEDICDYPKGLLPGEYCDVDTNCSSKVCQNTTCVGKPENNPCKIDAECNVGLYCFNNACTKTVTLGGACSDTKKCEIGSVCANAVCKKMMYFENEQAAPFPSLCKSYFMKNGLCKDAPKSQNLKSGDTGGDCPEDGLCKYASSNETYTEPCVCGMQTLGGQICRMGEGDADLAAVNINI
jgi:hypothetical protein